MSKVNSSYERKKLLNGKDNPKYIDLLDEDPIIAGQKFVCLSFISPEKILKQREIFLFEQFVKQWDLTKSMEKFGDYLSFISYKYNLNIESLISDFNDFAKEEELKLKNDSLLIENDYKNFLDKQEDKMNEKFNKEHKFQTSVRGIKVRGSFSTQEEAEIKCKTLREVDPNHDIFVGPIGCWMPFDPNAHKTGRVEYMEEELNQLHKEKLKNETLAKQEFEQRIKETKKKAIEENIKLAQKSGNVLTQTLDESGKLVGVLETVNFEEREAADVDLTGEGKIKQLNEAIKNKENAKLETPVVKTPVVETPVVETPMVETN
jgi:hypothetical protein